MGKENSDMTNGTVYVPSEVLHFLSDTDTFTFDDLVSTVCLNVVDSFNVIKHFLKNGIVCGEVKKIDPKVSICKQLTDEEIDYLADKNFAVLHMSFASEV